MNYQPSILTHALYYNIELLGNDQYFRFDMMHVYRMAYPDHARFWRAHLGNNRPMTPVDTSYLPNNDQDGTGGPVGQFCINSHTSKC